MNENQAMRKAHDRAASLRDYRFEDRYGNLTSIEAEGHRVNAATQKEEASIGPQDMHPNAVRW